MNGSDQGVKAFVTLAAGLAGRMHLAITSTVRQGGFVGRLAGHVTVIGSIDAMTMLQVLVTALIKTAKALPSRPWPVSGAMRLFISGSCSRMAKL